MYVNSYYFNYGMLLDMYVKVFQKLLTYTTHVIYHVSVCLSLPRALDRCVLFYLLDDELPFLEGLARVVLLFPTTWLEIFNKACSLRARMAGTS